MKGYFLLREKELLYHSSTSKSLSLFPPWHCKQLLDLFPRVFDGSLAYRCLLLKKVCNIKRKISAQFEMYLRRSTMY